MLSLHLNPFNNIEILLLIDYDIPNVMVKQSKHILSFTFYEHSTASER